MAEKKLDELPLRKLDKARYLAENEHFKLIAVDGPTICIKRGNAKERQYRMKCKNCGLPLAYKSRPVCEDLYIMDGALLQEDEKSGISSTASTTAGANVGKAQRHSEERGKFSSVSISTTTEAEEAELDSRELGANYDANASVIEMLLGRSEMGMMGKRLGTDQAAIGAKRRKGTLNQ